MSDMPGTSALQALPASGTLRGDCRETTAFAAELYGAMRRGEETSLALLSALSVDQMHRELQGEARLHADVLFTHLARLPRAVAVQALEDLLDAHRRRVLPDISGGQIDLFSRLNGTRP